MPHKYNADRRHRIPKTRYKARLSGTLFARLAHGIDSPHIPDV
jgi:hypothetical protein